MVTPSSSSARASERMMHMAACAIAAERKAVDVSACLREIREVRGFSMDDIAKMLCIHRVTYHYIEIGKTQLKVRHMLMLCDFYCVTPNDLLGWI